MIGFADVAGSPGGDAVAQAALQHDGQHDEKQHGGDRKLAAVMSLIAGIGHHTGGTVGQTDAPTVPEEDHDQTTDSGKPKYAAPAHEGDQDWSDQKYGNGAHGAAIGSEYTAAAVFVFIEGAGHEAYDGRPHEGLGEAVETPNDPHLPGGCAQGHQQVHADADAKAQSYQFFGLDMIAQPAGDDLADAVGDEAAGKRNGKGRLGEAGVGYHFHHNGTVIGAGYVADHIGDHEQNGQLKGGQFSG